MTQEHEICLCLSYKMVIPQKVSCASPFWCLTSKMIVQLPHQIFHTAHFEQNSDEKIQFSVIGKKVIPPPSVIVPSMENFLARLQCKLQNGQQLRCQDAINFSGGPHLARQHPHPVACSFNTAALDQCLGLEALIQSHHVS